MNWGNVITVVNMLGTLLIGAWMYLMKRNDKTNETVRGLTAQVEQLDKRLGTLTARTDAAPSHGDLSHVYESVNRLAETVNQLVGENRGQSDILRLILNRITEKGLS